MGRIGLKASDFSLSTIPVSADGMDTMQLGSSGGKVEISRRRDCHFDDTPCLSLY